MTATAMGGGTLRMPCGPPSQGFSRSDLARIRDDLAETQGGDGQVVAADAQDGQAQEDAEGHGRDDGEGDREPERDVGEAEGPGRCQQGDRVGAHGEEGHEAQVEESRQAERDVEAQAHEDVESDEGHRLGHERTHAQREPEDDQQQDDRHGDGGDPTLLVGHRAHPLPDPQTDPGEVGRRGDDDGERARPARVRPSDAKTVRASFASRPESMGVRSRPANSPMANSATRLTTMSAAQDARQHDQDGAQESQHRAAEERHPEAVDRRIAVERQDVEEIGRDVGQEGAQCEGGAEEDEPGQEGSGDEAGQHAAADGPDGAGRCTLGGHVPGRQPRDEERGLAQGHDLVDQRPLAEDRHDARRRRGR